MACVVGWTRSQSGSGDCHRVLAVERTFLAPPHSPLQIRYWLTVVELCCCVLRVSTHGADTVLARPTCRRASGETGRGSEAGDNT